MRKPEDIAFREGTFADALRLHKAWLNNEEGGKRLIVPAGFDLNRASLDGASLDGASLDGASLDGASLDGASLNRASLDGASLNDASLNRASLNDASLDGASLDGASLDGASLNRASLNDASLNDASLDDASLNRASLNDASLNDASLDGASLDGASLNDASLDGASLNDASLNRASLNDASLDGIRSAFNCIGNREQIKSAQIERYSITYDAKFLQIGCQRHTIEDWRNFDTTKIRRMDGEAAVDWWAKWNEIIFQIIEMSPATPGKAAPPSGDVQ